MADVLDRIAVDIASMYRDRAGGTIDHWRAAMAAETWYSAQEAVAARLADKVAPAPTADRAAAAVTASVGSATPRWADGLAAETCKCSARTWRGRPGCRTGGAVDARTGRAATAAGAGRGHAPERAHRRRVGGLTGSGVRGEAARRGRDRCERRGRRLRVPHPQGAADGRGPASSQRGRRGPGSCAARRAARTAAPDGRAAVPPVP